MFIAICVIQNVFVTLVEEGYLIMKHESSYDWQHKRYQDNAKKNGEGEIGGPTMGHGTMYYEIKYEDVAYPENYFLYQNFKLQNKKYECNNNNTCCMCN
jgi:hypothetical protein